MLLMLRSVAEAETIEGLFDNVNGLWTFNGADVADFTVGDILLELPFAEDDSALGLLGVRTRQQDIGSMASPLQQCG